MAPSWLIRQSMAKKTAWSRAIVVYFAYGTSSPLSHFILRHVHPSPGGRYVLLLLNFLYLQARSFSAAELYCTVTPVPSYRAFPVPVKCLS